MLWYGFLNPVHRLRSLYLLDLAGDKARLLKEKDKKASPPDSLSWGS
jgi:hypothetical protein